MNRCTRRLVVVALVVLALIPSAAQPLRAGDSSTVQVSPKVRKKLADEGRARILVQIRLPGGGHVPEGRLTHAAASIQRSDIAKTRGYVLAKLKKYNYRIVHQYTYVPLLALEVDASALAEIEGSPMWVDRVFEDSVKKPLLPESVPLIGGDVAWGRGFDGSGAMVAILDTGVDNTHPFLVGKVVEEACYSSTVAKHSTSFCPNGADEQVGPGAGVPCSLDAQGCFHGTHVAGIATGNGATAGVTFSGVAPGAQIMAVQVFSKFTSVADCGLFNTPCVGGYTSDLIAGLERVYTVKDTHNIASVNLSLGGGSFNASCDGEPEKAIIDTLRAAGIATVVAAGNDGTPTALASPACISSAVSVGSTTKADAVSSFSDVAPFMSLFAPGDSILSSVTGGGFAVLSGTSMATPHVAGSWAVLKQAAPTATVDQVLDALQTTGVPITDLRSGAPVTRPRIRLDRALAQLVPPVVTVTSVAPSSGKVGFTVPVTITGTGFVNGATVSAGTGISVSNVAVVSPTQLTATFTIAGTAALGARSVRVTLPTGDIATLSQGFTVNPAVTLSLVYNGKLRDRVGGGDAARAADGAPDGTFTMTLSAAGGRTITALRLQNGIGGVWDTTSPNASWLLGVATSLDGALLNNATTMAVNATVADNGSLVLFASDYGSGIGFGAGQPLTVIATLADGTSVQATTTIASTTPTVTAVTPNQGTSGAAVPVTIDGSAFVSGATVSAGAGITVTNVAFVSATRLSATFTIAGDATAGTRDVTVTNPGGAGSTLARAFTVNTPQTATLSLVYNGKLRDRVGQGDAARTGDGAADGTMTLTLTAPGGRTITALQLSNGIGGTWDTTSPNAPWLLGVATSLDGALLNSATTMAVNTTVPDGGSLRLFASDYGGGQGFAAGLTLTVTVTFSDGTSAQATATTSAAVVVSAVSPGQGTRGSTVPVTIDGSGFVSGATVSAGSGITVSNVAFVSSSRLTASFAIDGAASTGPRDITVTNPNGNGGSLASGFSVSLPVTLTLVYNGKLRDKVGPGDTALAADGLADATMTLTLSGAGGRTVSALQLSNGINGTWDTSAPNAAWVLGVAPSLDATLLNNTSTMAVNTFVADGGSLTLFASDYNSGQGFAIGRTLTLTVTFSDGTSAQATTTVTTTGVTVTAVTPSQGTKGSTVAITIDGSGFVSGATVSAGAGITVTNVAFVSAARLTASFVIDASAANGPRDVTVTNPGNAGGTLTNGFVVSAPVTAMLIYNGKLRDRVSGGDTGLGGDGAADATMTLSLNGSAGRTVTALQLSNGIGGAWDTISPNASWVIGVAPSLDAALVNNPTTMAINAAVADGGSLTLFASDYGGGQGFGAGRTLTVTVTLSDGSLIQASATVPSSVVAVNAVTPNQGTMGATVPVTIDGSGFVSGATVTAGTGITVTNVAFVSASRLTASFVIAGPTTPGARDVTVTNPDNSGAALVKGFTVNVPITMSLVYNGKLRDRVGGGDTALAPDGALDATITLTLSSAGGRTVTGVQLQNGIGGLWDTTSPNSSWLVGVAPTLDAALVNNATTMAVNTFVADGGSLTLFASDYGGGQGFAPGRTVTVTVTFSDGTSIAGTTVTQ
jgi:subtilisin